MVYVEGILYTLLTSGTSRACRKFKNLLTRRISWKEIDNEESYNQDIDKQDENKTCQLVWSGTTSKRICAAFKIHVCSNENEVRAVLTSSVAVR